MRPATLRRLAVPALAAALVLSGCSDDGGDDDADGTTTEAAGDEATTTTAAGDGSTTTGDDEASTTEADDEGGATTTTEDDDTDASTEPEEPGEDQEGAGAPDQEAPDVSWDLDAVQYRGQDGTRIAYLCPPDGEVGSVWGTGTYTDDSSVCSAAVHAGLINPVEGGRVVIEVAAGEDAYEGSDANGVASQDYAEWAGSFTFPAG